MIYLHDKYIIKAQTVTDTITGYDLLSEELVTVNSRECVVMPKSVLQLLNKKNKRTAMQLAFACSNDAGEAAALLGCTKRTLFNIR